jgi:hypothetical protein
MSSRCVFSLKAVISSTSRFVSGEICRSPYAVGKSSGVAAMVVGSSLGEIPLTLG